MRASKFKTGLIIPALLAVEPLLLPTGPLNTGGPTLPLGG